MKRRGLLSFQLGLLLFGATETAWLAYAAANPTVSRWVLEPNRGILVALAVHFIAAIAYSAAFRPKVTDFFSFAAGVVTAVVVGLFFVGGGNLWPIVLLVDVLLLAPALLTGLGRGLALRHVVHRAA